MMPCCRRHQPRTRKTFLDNPQLLGIRPAPTPTSLNNFKATHSATISKDIHTDSQLQTGKTRKTAVLGRVRRDTKGNETISAPNGGLRFATSDTTAMMMPDKMHLMTKYSILPLETDAC